MFVFSDFSSHIQLNTASSPPTQDSLSEPGQLNIQTSKTNQRSVDQQQRVAINQMALSLRDTSALQQVVSNALKDQPTFEVWVNKLRKGIVRGIAGCENLT